MESKTSTVGSLISALFASVCCIGPVFFAALGVGAGATGILADTARSLGWLTPFRPIFILITFAFLGIGFYKAYRKKDCQGERCGIDDKRKARLILWIITALVTILILYPYKSYIGL